jgi:hypothetical protein
MLYQLSYLPRRNARASCDAAGGRGTVANDPARRKREFRSDAASTLQSRGGDDVFLFGDDDAAAVLDRHDERRGAADREAGPDRHHGLL